MNNEYIYIYIKKIFDSKSICLTVKIYELYFIEIDVSKFDDWKK